MKKFVPYLFGLSTLPVLIGATIVANDLFLKKVEYDCSWCDYTTQNKDSGTIGTPNVVAETKITSHQFKNHRHLNREYKKLRKSGLSHGDAHYSILVGKSEEEVSV